MMFDAELVRLREAEYERARRQAALTGALGPMPAGVFARWRRRTIQAALNLRRGPARRARSAVVLLRALPDRVRLALDRPQAVEAGAPPVVSATCVRCFARVWRDDIAAGTTPGRCVCLRCHQPVVRAVRLSPRLHAEIAAVLDGARSDATKRRYR